MDTIKNMKRQLTEWKKQLQIISDKELISRVCKDRLQLNKNKNKKTQTTQLKYGQKNRIDISPKKILQMANKSMKRYSTTNQQGIAHQNYNEIPLHTH